MSKNPDEPVTPSEWMTLTFVLGWVALILGMVFSIGKKIMDAAIN